jgi:thioredoxin-like negative regulator of GroEL
MGNIEKAVEQLKVARELSPKKQQIIFEQGLAESQRKDFKAALNYYRDAYELEPTFMRASTYYATAALHAGQPELVHEIIDTDAKMNNFANDSLAIQAAYNAKAYDLLEKMFMTRITRNPEDPQLRVNLAVIKVEQGDTPGAIEILRTAAEEIESFKAQAEGFIADLEAGRMPGEQPTVEVGGVEVNSQTVTLPSGG